MQSLALRHRFAHRNPMTELEYFELIGSRAFYRPVQVVSFEQAIDMVADAMRTAREVGASDLLVNTIGLTGFSPPSVFARYSMATKWAQTAGASLRVALVARPELIDRQKIGVLMLQNRGGSGDVFINEAEALDWLNAGLSPGQRSPRKE